MKLRALKRWLIRCGFGTTCFLGAASLAMPFVLTAPSMIPAAAAPGNAPAEAIVLNRGNQAADAIVLQRVPAKSAPQSAVPGMPRQLRILPGDAVPLEGGDQQAQATLVMETMEPPVGMPIPTQQLETGADVSVLVFRRATLVAANGEIQPVAQWSESPAPPPGAAAPAQAAGTSLQVLTVTPGPAPIFPRAEPGPQRRSFVDLTAAPCFAHGPDYTWIVGQVEHSGITKQWRLRYASVDEVDQFGGRVILVENHHVSYMVDGMYVHVHGHLVNPDSTGKGPVYYRVESFQTVDNPNVPQIPAGPNVTQTSTNPAPAQTPPAPHMTPTPSVPSAIQIPALPSAVPPPADTK